MTWMPRSISQATMAGQNSTPRTHDSIDYDMVAVGGIYQTLSNVNPGLPTASGGLGYGTWARIAQGRVLLGVDENTAGQNAPNLTLGQAAVTPAGAVAAPVFTGSTDLHTSSVSAGTPSGTIAAPAFNGTPTIATSSVSAGTPAGSNTQPVFTGSAMAAHAHELPFQLASTTATRQIAAATFGTGTSRAATGASAAGSSNTTSAAVARSQAVSAGTPAGTCSAPTFVGQTMPGHAHTITPTGTISAPGFTGSPHTPHDHTLTPAGTNSAPAFTGQAHTLIQPSLTAYFWTRTA